MYINIYSKRKCPICFYVYSYVCISMTILSFNFHIQIIIIAPWPYVPQYPRARPPMDLHGLPGRNGLWAPCPLGKCRAQLWGASQIEPHIYIYIYIYIYIHIHIYTYIYTYLFLCINMYAYMCIRISIFNYNHTYIDRERDV